MTPRPNALGYIVLGSFVLAGAYAFAREARASTCPRVTRELLQKFGVEKDTSVAWFPEREDPPDASSEAGSQRISFPDFGVDSYDSPVIVVLKEDQFYRYRATGPGEVTVERFPQARDAFCEMARQRGKA